jgi:hypothetical protein
VRQSKAVRPTRGDVPVQVGTSHKKSTQAASSERPVGVPRQYRRMTANGGARPQDDSMLSRLSQAIKRYDLLLC